MSRPALSPAVILVSCTYAAILGLVLDPLFACLPAHWLLDQFVKTYVEQGIGLLLFVAAAAAIAKLAGGRLDRLISQYNGYMAGANSILLCATVAITAAPPFATNAFYILTALFVYIFLTSLFMGQQTVKATYWLNDSEKQQAQKEREAQAIHIATTQSVADAQAQLGANASTGYARTFAKITLVVMSLALGILGATILGYTVSVSLYQVGIISGIFYALAAAVLFIALWAKCIELGLAYSNKVPTPEKHP